MPATVTEQALRAHFRSHNASVLASSAIALVFSALGWVFLYGTAYWLTLFTVSVIHAGEGHVSSAFNDIFLASSGTLLLVAWAEGRLFPHERPMDRRPPAAHALDVILFIPRFTMSAWNNISALASLGRGDLRLAAGLLDLMRDTGSISLQEVSANFPNGRSLKRVIDALIVARLADQRTTQHLAMIYLSSLAPEIFRRKTSTPPEPADELESMPRVKIVGQDGPRDEDGSPPP